MYSSHPLPRNQEGVKKEDLLDEDYCQLTGEGKDMKERYEERGAGRREKTRRRGRGSREEVGMTLVSDVLLLSMC